MYSSLSPREIYKRMFSNAGVYGVGTLLIKGGYLLLIPLYWKLLTPEDFGTIGVQQVLILFLTPLLEMGFFGAVQRLYYTWPENERGSYLAAMWTSNVVVGLVICLLLTLTGPWLFPVLFKSVPFAPYLLTTLWMAFFANFGQVPLGLMRIREETKLYTFFTSGQFVAQHVFSLLFIFLLEDDAAGFVYGQLLGAFIISVFYCRYTWRELIFPFQKEHFWKPFNYAYPGTFSAVFEGASASLDRFLLDKYVPLAEIGLFTNARQIGGALNVFNFVMKTAATPLLYRVASERDDGPKLLGRISMIHMFCMLFPGLGIALLSKEMILFINNPHYFGVYDYIPIFVLGFFLLAMGSIYGRGMDLAQKTKLQPVVPIVGLMAGLGSMMYLIPRYGAFGAAWAYVVTMLTRDMAEIGLACYYYPRPLHLGKTLFALGVASLTFVLGYHLPEELPIWSSALIKICLIVAAFILVFINSFGFDSIRRVKKVVLSRMKKSA